MRKFYATARDVFDDESATSLFRKNRARASRNPSSESGSERLKLNSAQQYEKYILNGLRYLTRDLLELRRMTIREYNLRMTAFELRRADKLEEYAQLALFIRNASLYDDNGVFKAQAVKDLYDATKVEDEIFDVEGIQEEQTFARLRALSKIIKGKQK